MSKVFFLDHCFLLNIYSFQSFKITIFVNNKLTIYSFLERLIVVVNDKPEILCELSVNMLTKCWLKNWKYKCTRITRKAKNCKNVLSYMCQIFLCLLYCIGPGSIKIKIFLQSKNFLNYYNNKGNLVNWLAKPANKKILSLHFLMFSGPAVFFTKSQEV